MTDVRIQNAVGRWLELWVKQCRKDHGIERCPTYADATHSALLKRLLSGKDPTEHVPPKAFGYPWYELEDGKECPILDRDFYVGDDSVRICQSGYTRDGFDDSTGTGKLRCNHNGQMYRVYIELQARMIRKVTP